MTDERGQPVGTVSRGRVALTGALIVLTLGGCSAVGAGSPGPLTTSQGTECGFIPATGAPLIFGLPMRNPTDGSLTLTSASLGDIRNLSIRELTVIDVRYGGVGIWPFPATGLSGNWERQWADRKAVSGFVVKPGAKKELLVTVSLKPGHHVGGFTGDSISYTDARQHRYLAQGTTLITVADKRTKGCG